MRRVGAVVGEVRLPRGVCINWKEMFSLNDYAYTLVCIAHYCWYADIVYTIYMSCVCTHVHVCTYSRPANPFGHENLEIKKKIL